MMLKTERCFLFLMTALILAGLAGTGWSAEKPLSASVVVATPTVLLLKLIPWADDCSINEGIINFGAGSNNKTSWKDKSVDDGWLSNDADVGFSIIAVGPGDKRLNIKCGELKKTGATDEIPYQSPDKQTDYFGFSAISVPEPVTYLAGSSEAMAPHTAAGWTYNFSSYGKEIAIYNMLKIPAYAQPGEYKTTGSEIYGNYIITLM